MARHVQIPELLFYQLMAYFCAVDQPVDPDAAELYDICIKGLNTKYNALQDRRHYSMMHDPLASPTAREQARQAYLDNRGIPSAFRWSAPDPDDQSKDK